MVDLNTFLIVSLYFFLFISLLFLWRTKSYHWSLSVLIFGELIAVTVAKAPALFPASIFTAKLFISRWEINEEIVTTKNTILFGLVGTSLAVFFACIFWAMGRGWFTSISLSMGLTYFAIIFLPKKVRELAIRLWKISIALLAPLALLETEPSTVSIPPLIYHYIITALWIKHDLPKITEEPGPAPTGSSDKERGGTSHT